MPSYDWASGSSVNVFLGVMSMVLVTWDLVLFEGMSVKFKGKIMLHYSRRVK